MGRFSALKTKGKLNQAIAGFFGEMLRKEIVSGVLSPARQPNSKAVMQTLITDPEHLISIDAFAPVVPTSTAKIASALTRKPTGRSVAVVFRSCELRAYLELVKLKQELSTTSS